VSNSKYLLRFNVGFIINQPVGTFRTLSFEAERIQFETEPVFEHFKGEVKVNRVVQGILIQGDFQAAVPVECVRCLEGFLQPVHTEFDELYAFREEEADESGQLLSENGFIDLGPVVREYLLLEVPIRSHCKDDCRGLCDVCGANLNQGACEHYPRAEGSVSRAGRIGD
jgi:uncharacterized protein